MKKNILLPVIVFVLLFSLHKSAGAAIADSSASGFTVRFEQSVNCPADSLYSYLVRDVGKWWNPDHTWSGKASNLSIQPVPGGCFCEKLDNGGFVRHLGVVYADPGKMLRLEGGLGPLQMMAVTGSMSFVIKPDGISAKITLTYTVGGYFPGGPGKWPGLVDMVIGEQFGRLKTYAESKK